MLNRRRARSEGEASESEMIPLNVAPPVIDQVAPGIASPPLVLPPVPHPVEIVRNRAGGEERRGEGLLTSSQHSENTDQERETRKRVLRSRKERDRASKSGNDTSDTTESESQEQKIIRLIRKELALKPGTEGYSFDSSTASDEAEQSKEPLGRSLRLMKDLKNMVCFKYTTNGDMKQHILLFSQMLRETGRTFSKLEYNSLLIASLPEDSKKAQVLSLLGKRGLVNTTRTELHYILSSVYQSSDMNVIRAREKFYRYRPTPDRLRLVDILTDLASLANRGNVRNSDFYAFVQKILPVSAAIYIQLALKGSTEPDAEPTPAALLKALECVKDSVEEELAAKYKKDGKNVVKKVEGPFPQNSYLNKDGKDKQQTCANCLRRGHVVEGCFYKDICRLCSKTDHRTPSCPSYPSMSPCVKPCQKCIQKGKYNFHDGTVCLEN